MVSRLIGIPSHGLRSRTPNITATLRRRIPGHSQETDSIVPTTVWWGPSIESSRSGLGSNRDEVPLACHLVKLHLGRLISDHRSLRGYSQERACSTRLHTVAPFVWTQSTDPAVKHRTRTSGLFIWHDPQTGVALGRDPRAAMCVRIVDVHVSCSSHEDAQFAASFIDPRA